MIVVAAASSCPAMLWLLDHASSDFHFDWLREPTMIMDRLGQQQQQQVASGRRRRRLLFVSSSSYIVFGSAAGWKSADVVCCLLSPCLVWTMTTWILFKFEAASATLASFADRRISRSWIFGCFAIWFCVYCCWCCLYRTTTTSVGWFPRKLSASCIQLLHSECHSECCCCCCWTHLFCSSQFVMHNLAFSSHLMHLSASFKTDAVEPDSFIHWIFSSKNSESRHELDTRQHHRRRSSVWMHHHDNRRQKHLRSMSIVRWCNEIRANTRRIDSIDASDVCEVGSKKENKTIADTRATGRSSDRRRRRLSLTGFKCANNCRFYCDVFIYINIIILLLCLQFGSLLNLFAMESHNNRFRSRERLYSRDRDDILWLCVCCSWGVLRDFLRVCVRTLRRLDGGSAGTRQNRTKGLVFHWS